MNVGDKIKYTIDGIEYLGVIIIKDTNTSMYKVSIEGLGKVIESDGSDIVKL